MEFQMYPANFTNNNHIPQLASQNLQAQREAQRTMTTIYTAEDVAKHGSKNDLWVVIHSTVYDITSYLEDHPGGVPSLIEVAGQDATQAFEELGHSQHAKDLLERFQIGKLDHEEENVRPAIVRKLTPEPEPFSTSSSLLDTAVIITLAEVLSISTIITLGFIVARRVGRYAAFENSWSVPSILLRILPWFTSTTLASVLIQRLVKRTFSKPVSTIRPTHFKVNNLTLTSKPKEDKSVLKASQYIDLPVSSVERLSDNTNKIVLELPEKNSVLGLPTGQHISIRSTVNAKEIMRQYTPTSSNKDLGRLELVIKNYDDGLMTGQYLKDIKAGDKLSLSGPKGQMHYRRGLASTINMIAGGTGITPMYQLIRSICEDPRDNTKIVLVYANQTESDILLRSELDRFVSEHSDQLQVHYILSKPGDEWCGRVGRCSQQVCEEVFSRGTDKQNKAMLCGPKGMVDNAKEWLVNMDYNAPGSVSKMADQVFIF